MVVLFEMMKMRPASLSPAYSCLGCHNDDPNDDIPEKTLEQAAQQSMNMHQEASFVHGISMNAFQMKVYPNPAYDKVMIDYTLAMGQEISLNIYALTGELVYSTGSEFKQAGEHTMTWNGRANSQMQATPGIYLISLEAKGMRSVQKLILQNE